MSSEAMRALAHEIADYAATSPNWKDRVTAFAEAIGAEWGRAKTLYYASARRIDATEMDRAREAANELKQARLRAKNREHLEWLQATLQHLRNSDENFHGPTIDRVERALVAAGIQNCSRVETRETGRD